MDSVPNLPAVFFHLSRLRDRPKNVAIAGQYLCAGIHHILLLTLSLNSHKSFNKGYPTLVTIKYKLRVT